MGKLIQRKVITPSQYARANKVLMVIMILSYITYVIVEILNVNKFGFSVGTLIRCGLYIVSAIAGCIVYKLKRQEKFCMLFIAINFAIISPKPACFSSFGAFAKILVSAIIIEG